MSPQDFRDNWIDTPTFELTPVEKPDMSPFLFHMTGENTIYSILNGEGKEESLSEGYGWIRSSIPESKPSSTYNAPVVCLTESPIFCLDFFRFRSYRRWIGNQRFGIGFSKTSLVNRLVRPCIYAESDLCKRINRLYHQIDKINELAESIPVKDRSIITDISSLINSIYPLTVSLNENNHLQGFMWEREWRLPSSDGLSFHYSDIKVVCCSSEETNRIKEILAGYEQNIQFVNTWVEYNEVTDYLSNRERSYQLNNRENATNQQILSSAKISVKQMKRTISELERYMSVTNRFREHSNEIQENINNIKQQILEREVQMKELEKINNK